MKLLIGVVVALLCMQTIQASSVRLNNECKSNLRFSKADVKRWFQRTFKPEHDIAHEYLVTIKEICDLLQQTLDGFLITPPTECEIAQFFKALYQMHLKAKKATTQLRYSCDALLTMSDDYKCRRNAVCNNDLSCSGCEAETDKENCDLLEFQDGLTVMAAKAKELLDCLAQSCDKLYVQARLYDCEKKPSCNDTGCGCGTGENGSADQVRSFLNDFLPSFNKEHGIAHTKLSGVEKICDLLSKAITAWINRK